MNVWCEGGQQQPIGVDTRAHAHTRTYRPFRMLYEKLGIVWTGLVVVATCCWLVGGSGGWLMPVSVGWLVPVLVGASVGLCG